ncbi:MAG: UDP-N-acetylmuramate:L-alanyl-gamma-D-glutamyl-meso-diaminopimelate ligase [Woeseia sp.]
MHIHILGICGTFMGGIAALAKAAGHEVSGADSDVYPPMCTQLKRLGIVAHDGYDVDQLEPVPDFVVIGNALSRGNVAVEAVLDRGIPYTSGPQWLSEHFLAGQHVIALAGTHGKTTTASMVAWILEAAGHRPGFLVGGVPANFGATARYGASRYFVVEADEYDTAFFDKRAKFVHYRPQTLVLGNLEFDHADIYKDLDAILWQFHQLLRTIPKSGRVILNGADRNLETLLEMGCWSSTETFSIAGEVADWTAAFSDPGERRITVSEGSGITAEGSWQLGGSHNLENAIAAIAAAKSAGVPVRQAVEALSRFKGVKRRLERTATVADIAIYDDFAHHPTAIRRTIAGMKKRYPGQRIIVALEPRSNTMKLGVHNEALAASLEGASLVCVYRPEELGAKFDDCLSPLGERLHLHSDYDELVAGLAAELQPGDQVIFMSNGGFGSARQNLTGALQNSR